MRPLATRPPPSLLASALWYVEQGLWVFALTPGSKVPMPGTHGFHDAANDPETVRAMWAKTPRANVGIATGHVVDVIDVDGVIGAASWYGGAWDDDDNYRGPWPLGKVSTPRPGGQHIYIATRSGRGNATGKMTGVDYRGLGGYVVAPPSTTDVGAYEWFLPLAVTA